jgi:hypothetical protein
VERSYTTCRNSGEERQRITVMSDKKFSNSDYLLGKVDPFGLDDPYQRVDLTKLMNTPTVSVNLPVKKPTPKPVQKPQVQKSKFVNRAQRIDREQKLAVTAERVKNEKAYNIMQQARALDNKIKRSKQPSYEDLQEFHKLSQAMEDIV